MVAIVNIHEAKTNLSRLLVDVQSGQEIIIAKFGHPIAKLVPFTAPKKDIKFGMLKGKGWIAEDFDQELPDQILKSFYGGTDEDPT